MNNLMVANDVYYVGANDSERRIFDQLIPLPDGTTYNSYIIKGSQKTALIDTVDPTKKQVLIDNLKKLNITKIDFIVAHHGEQDHSGCISDVLNYYPMAKVVTNQKCKTELMDLLLIKDEKFFVIEDGQEISLGNKTLKFLFTPWVHWPETFVTLDIEDKVLFTCDFLGSHFSFNSQEGLFTNDKDVIYEPAKRYYAEIMSPFRNNIRKNIDIVESLNFDIIAPSHGPLYNGKDFIKFIINCYKEWSSEEVKNKVLITYVSMHGSTEKIIEYFTQSLLKKGVIVKSFDLSVADVGEIAMELLDSATAVIGTPTVLTGPHPSAVFAAYLIRALRPKTKFLTVIGSYGWGGKIIDFLTNMFSNLKAEILDPVLVKGYPKDKDFDLLDELADKIARKHKALN